MPRPSAKNEFLEFILSQYYSGDSGQAARLSGYTRQQIDNWRSGKNTPRESTITWLIHRAFVPEYRIIVEFAYLAIDGSEKPLRSILSKMLEGHHKSNGIYAFYDSSGQLIYVGKSQGNLLDECYQQIRKPPKKSVFPRGIRPPKRRLSMVRYLSAYEVTGIDLEDNAKHVESLILRISKPSLNSVLGTLQDADKELVAP